MKNWRSIVVLPSIGHSFPVRSFIVCVVRLPSRVFFSFFFSGHIEREEEEEEEKKTLVSSSSNAPSKQKRKMAIKFVYYSSRKISLT